MEDASLPEPQRVTPVSTTSEKRMLGEKKPRKDKGKETCVWLVSTLCLTLTLEHLGLIKGRPSLIPCTLHEDSVARI